MKPDTERIAAAAAIIASRCTPHWREYDNAEGIARAVLSESDRHAGNHLTAQVDIGGGHAELGFVVVPEVSDE